MAAHTGANRAEGRALPRPQPTHRIGVVAQIIWLVDDTPQWHTVTGRTVARVSGWQLESFHTGSAAMLAFARMAEHAPATLPTVVLMDFYLGQMRGDAVTEALRELEPPGQHCTIVGHSSMAHGSELIQHAGGDCRIRKHVDERGINPSLLAWLQTFPVSQP
jgi:CheY-like chemotaxis protein